MYHALPVAWISADIPLQVSEAYPHTFIQRYFIKIDKTLKNLPSAVLGYKLYNTSFYTNKPVNTAYIFLQ